MKVKKLSWCIKHVTHLYLLIKIFLFILNRCERMFQYGYDSNIQIYNKHKQEVHVNHKSGNWNKMYSHILKFVDPIRKARVTPF